MMLLALIRRTGCLFGLLVVAVGPSQADDVRPSVVKIEVTKVAPNLVEPYKRRAPVASSGTGVIIHGNRILTNAHVVSHARRVTVQAFQSDAKVRAEVVAIAAGIDLALLEVNDDSFFDERPAIEFDRELPEVRSTVNAYGFPFGGTQISVTEGIVSRIEFASYYFSSMGLRIQIDAALNPGNSGGPAVKDGRLVGLVFSRISKGDNVGFLIPVQEIELFLNDVKDGQYDGKLVLDVSTQTLENDAIRRKMDLASEVGGVMVNDPDVRDDDASGLQHGDIITAIDGQSIDREGKVPLGDDNRVGLAYLLQQHVDDDEVDLSILRDGESIERTISLRRGQPFFAGYLGHGSPDYFIAGPLLFMPASVEFVTALGASRRWAMLMIARQSPLVARGFERLTDNNADEQLVVTGPRFLPHPITEGYSDVQHAVVERFNGTKVRNLKHLVELMRDSRDDYFVFSFAGRGTETLVFDREEFLESTEEVLDDNGIRRRGTPELMDVWEAEPTRPKVAFDTRPHLETLRTVWQTIDDVHWDRDLIAERWASLLPEFEQKMLEVTTLDEARGVIDSMIGRLEQSHFGIIPKTVFDSQKELGVEAGNGTIGMEVRWIEGELVVTRVRPDGSAAKGGIVPGDRVDRIRDKPAEAIIAKAKELAEHKTGREATFIAIVAESLLGGPVGKSFEIAWTDSNGKSHAETFDLQNSPGDFAAFGNLPAVEVILDTKVLEGDILYYRFSSFFNPIPLVMKMKELMEEHSDAKGLIIDVRGNRGGIVLMAAALCNWLTTEPTVFGIMKGAESELNLKLNPRKPHFEGQVVVLTDEVSISSAEILAGSLQDAGMATVIGGQTAGLVLPSMVTKLPNGDRFQYAISDFATGAGNRLEGDGVVPDVLVELTRESLAGGDPVLQKAREQILKPSAAAAPSAVD